MRFARPRRALEDERILPLINVVFLLLIFFMVAGRLSAGDPFAVIPPRSVSEGLAKDRDLVLLVGREGRLALNGKETDLASLKDALADAVNDPAEQRVHIKADGRAVATMLVEVMEHLREAGVTRLTLLTLPSPATGSPE